MLTRRLGHLAALLGLALGVLGGPLLGSTAASASAAPSLDAYTVCYNAASAGDFVGTADEAAGIWNERLVNAQLSGCGNDVMIYEIYGGGSYAQVFGLGQGEIYIDYEQAQQYNPVRIMAHELGHILGLPDNYNGDCGILMSGHSAGTACTNPIPSAGEVAEVDGNFGVSGTAPARTYRELTPAA